MKGFLQVMSITLIKYYHATSNHAYLMDSLIAEKLVKLLKDDPDVVDFTQTHATSKEIQRYNIWTPSTKSDDWLRVAQEQYFAKLVPLELKDCKQPEESSLMKALSRIGSSILLERGLNQSQPAVVSHKVLS